MYHLSFKEVHRSRELTLLLISYWLELKLYAYLQGKLGNRVFILNGQGVGSKSGVFLSRNRKKMFVEGQLAFSAIGLDGGLLFIYLYFYFYRF